MRLRIPTAITIASLAWFPCGGAAEFFPEQNADAPDVNDAMPIDASVPDEEALVKADSNDGELLNAEENSDVAVALPVSQRRFGWLLRATGRATYDDNIFIQHTNKVSDLILSVAPGFTVGMGDLRDRKGGFVAFSYDAEAFFFLNNSEQNAVNHDASLRGQWAGSKLTLGGYFGFRDLTEPNSETGGRVNEKIYQGSITATYAWSEKTSFGTEVSETVSDYKNLLNTKETDLRLWVDHEISVLTKVGLGVTLGHVDVSEGGSQNFEQLLARVNYSAGSKLNLLLQAGGEFRQIENASSQTTPVFSLGATYSPYELLTVQLDGYRRVQPAVNTAGTNTVVTGVSLGVKYRYFERFETSVVGAYEQTNYDPVSGNQSSNRKDKYFLVRIAETYAVSRNTRVGAFYQFRSNDSTDVDRSFTNHQVGVEVSIAF